jgi:hypothetical protein
VEEENLKSLFSGEGETPDSFLPVKYFDTNQNFIQICTDPVRLSPVVAAMFLMITAG